MTATEGLARVGVLLSGRGSNFLALYSAMERGEVPAEIVLVVSNDPDAPGVAKARDLGIDTACFVRADFDDVAAWEEAMVAALREARADWVCLAGFMRILSPVFVRAFPRRILNIHPSLLPSFPGLHAQRQALEHGVKVSGCTVHLVDESLDGGPIVEQRAVRVEEGDTEETLSARILVDEHRAYPDALRRLVREGWELRGRRVVFE